MVGGKVPTDINLFDWAKEVEQRGAGEILFTPQWITMAQKLALPIEL